MHRNLAFNLKRRVRSAHYRALRLIHGKHSRDQLDQLSMRASPDEFADFIIAKTAARIINESRPKRLSESITSHSYSERRRPHQVFFYDASIRRIGRQCLKNRLHTISKHMNFEWTICDRDALRVGLKKCFFKYYRFNENQIQVGCFLT